MSQTKDLKATLQRELESLAQTRDELLVQLSLAKAEAKDEFSQLEERWTRVQDELKRTAEASEGTIKDSVRALLDDLRTGYERVKTQLKQPAEQH
jgi:gas vesicle protein